MADLAALEQQYGLPPGLLSAIQGAEGSGPNSVSPKGAVGTFQFMPATAKAYGLNDPTDPDASAVAAAKYMADTMQRYKTTDPRVLMAEYNGGPRQAAAVLAGNQPPARETQNYIKKAPQMDLDGFINGLPDANKGNGLDDFIAKLPSAQPQESAGQAALIAAGRGLTQLGRGAQQAYYGATGDQQAQDALKAKVDQENALYAPLQAAHPIATAVGEGLPSIAAGPVGMAAQGALEYGTPEEKAARAAGGFIGGKVGQYGGQLIGRVLQPVRGAANDAVQATKDLFDKYGINGLPGQITGSVPLQLMEQTLAKLPGGGRVRDIAASQQQALNAATMKAAGGDGAAVTPEAVRGAMNTSGQAIGDIAAPVEVKIDDRLVNDLADVESRYMQRLPSQQRPVVQRYIDEILQHDGTIPGAVYQGTRADLGSEAAGATKGSLKNALSGIKGALDDAFDRSAGPDAAAAMQAVRDQYATGIKLQKMATTTGDISPARLATAGKVLPQSAQDLPQLGARMKTLPDSGTAQRLFYQSLLSGGIGAGAGVATGDPEQALKWGAGAAAGQVAGPYIASQLLTRAPIKNYLTSTIISDEINKLLGRAGAVGGGLLGLSSAK